MDRFLVWAVTIPAPAALLDQKQYAYYLEHKDKLLEKIGFKCIKSEKVPGQKREETLKVPGSYMKTLFASREAAHEDLRIVPGVAQPKIGPYGCAQFMSWVSGMPPTIEHGTCCTLLSV